jgi:8-oxo-dGTP pyrophosphatase MutT (NUDIX family)
MTWEFPRGKCDKGDKTLRECLTREVKEETGLDVKILRYIDKYKYIADGGERISTQYNFLCDVINKNQKVKLSNEHDGFKWVSTGGEVELLVPQEMKRIVSQVFNSLSVYEYNGIQKIDEWSIDE